MLLKSIKFLGGFGSNRKWASIFVPEEADLNLDCAFCIYMIWNCNEQNIVLMIAIESSSIFPNKEW